MYYNNCVGRTCLTLIVDCGRLAPANQAEWMWRRRLVVARWWVGLSLIGGCAFSVCPLCFSGWEAVLFWPAPCPFSAGPHCFARWGAVVPSTVAEGVCPRVHRARSTSRPNIKAKTFIFSFLSRFNFTMSHPKTLYKGNRKAFQGDRETLTRERRYPYKGKSFFLQGYVSFPTRARGTPYKGTQSPLLVSVAFFKVSAKIVTSTKIFFGSW